MMFLDAIASPSTYPCQWVSESLIVSDLEISSEVFPNSRHFCGQLILRHLIFYTVVKKVAPTR